MEIKKCMWCLTEFETKSNGKYCSETCKIKTENLSENETVKKGFFAVVGDLTTSLFS